MEHNHSHPHNHSPQLTHVNRAFIIGIVLNSTFVIIEFVTGIFTNSLALLSDAGHNLSDVAGLGLSLFAIQMAKRKATEKYTYGYNKSTILASLANSVILLIAVGSIGWEAIQRFMKPEETQGSIIAIVAAIGIIINVASALLFLRDKDKDLNMKGAYLHLMSDAFIALGVVIAGIVIHYTHFYWLDPLISIVIMIVVTIGTWNILSESLRLSLDAVPKNVDTEKITETVTKMEGIKSIHHVHIWAMSTTKNAMTAHLVVENNLNEKQVAEIKHQLKHQLEQYNIQHITLETESENCSDEEC